MARARGCSLSRKRGSSRGLRRRWAALTQNQRLTFIGVIISAAAVISGSLITAIIPMLARSSGGVTGRKMPSVRTLGITAATYGRSYRIVFPVDNLEPDEQQLEQISLIMTFPGPACAEVPVVLYKVQNSIIVKRPGGYAQGSVSGSSRIGPGLQVPAIGKLNYGCGLDQLHLTFSPPGLILDGLSTTPVEIDIPMRLEVTHQFLPSQEAMRQQVTVPGINSVDYMAFRVSSSTNSGTRLDSCFVLSADPSFGTQGPRSCNSLVEGSHAFRPLE